MKQLRFDRRSVTSPPEREVLEIEVDGSFTMWRSTGDRVGRFAGSLDELDEIEAEINRAIDRRPPRAEPLLPDSSVERLMIDDETMLQVSADDELDGPWGDLLQRCRGLLDDLRAHPLAALSIDLTEPTRPTLVHVGTEGLHVELIQPAAVVETWLGGQLTASARGYADVIASTVVDEGWRLEIEVPDAVVAPGATILAQVGLDAYDGELPIPVAVHATTQPR